MSFARVVIAGLLALVLGAAAKAQTPSTELVYARMKPCRVFDTTKTQKIPANSAKSFLISGPGDYAAQGGAANGCGVPASAQAVSINVTAINGAAAGTLSAMPYAQATSTTTVRFPVTAPETIGGVVDLLQNRITLRTTNTVNAIGDVTGYYAEQIRGRINSDGSLGVSTSRVVSSALYGVGYYEVVIDRPVSECVVQASIDGSGPYPMSSYTLGSKVVAQIYDLAGASSNRYWKFIVAC